MISFQGISGRIRFTCVFLLLIMVAAAVVTPGLVSGAVSDKKNVITENPLDMQVDFSSIKEDTTLEQVVELIRESLPSSVSLVVLWNDLAENAFVDRDSEVGVDGIGKTSLKNGVDIILRSLSELAPLKYVYRDGVISIMADDQEENGRKIVKGKKAVPATAEIDEASRKLLDTRLDFSFVTSDTTFEEVINQLRSQKIEGLSIVVLWNNLSDAFVDKDSAVCIDGFGKTSLKTGLELILKSVGSNISELIYTCKDGMIVIETSEDSVMRDFIIKEPATPIWFARHYIRLIGVDDGFVFEGRRYKKLSELDEPLSKLAEKSNTILEWAFAPGKMPEENSMAWLGVAYFIGDLERLVSKHDLGGLCYAGEMPIDSKRVTFPAGEPGLFEINKEIELELRNGPFELQSITFKKNDPKLSGPPYKALLKVRETSWPKTKIQLRLQLRTGYPDFQRTVIYKTFENSGKIAGVAAVSSRVIEIPFFEVMDDDFMDDVKQFEIRIRRIGPDLDKTKAAEVIGKWIGAYEVSDIHTMKELLAGGNEKALEEVMALEPPGSGNDRSAKAKENTIVLNITKTIDGRYMVLTLSLRGSDYHHANYYLVADGDGFKIDWDIKEDLQKSRDLRTMTSEEFWQKDLKDKIALWENAEGQKLKILAEEIVQQYRNTVITKEYADKQNITVYGLGSMDISRVKEKIEKLERMTPQQVRDEIVKGMREYLEGKIRKKTARK